jgi:hypothetical protein
MAAIPLEIGGALAGYAAVTALQGAGGGGRAPGCAHFEPIAPPDFQSMNADVLRAFEVAEGRDD